MPSSQSQSCFTFHLLFQEVETECAAARVSEYVTRMLAGTTELAGGKDGTQDYNLLQKLVAARDLADQPSERNKLSADEVGRDLVSP